MGIISTLSEIFQIDITKLLSGEMPQIKPEVGNVKRTKFYVCEKCGNVLTNLGGAEILCCGKKLMPLRACEPDSEHMPEVRKIEDDYYITFSHLMTKEHYISFVSYVRFDRVLTIKLYPEQNAEVRFPQMRGGKLYFYCSKNGLFEVKI